MVQEELKDIYEDSVIYLRYPEVPWGTLRYPEVPWGTLRYPEVPWGTLGHTVVYKEQLSRILSFSLEPSRD